jgi:hypothetical protein
VVKTRRKIDAALKAKITLEALRNLRTAFCGRGTKKARRSSQERSWGSSD